jgi:hypothetical protein
VLRIRHPDRVHPDPHALGLHHHTLFVELIPAAANLGLEALGST